MQCTDQIVGDILSSWRYDISGISPEMRTDYESHFADCPHCRRRQQLHRTVDVILTAVTTLSVLAFVLALAVIHHLEPRRHWALVMRLDHRDVALSLQMAATAGLLVSLLCWILVAIATPAPVYLTGVFHDRIPEELRTRLHRNVA
jgi:DNA-binding helix-hairpin-helix protein with protein kinase domain